MQTFYRLEMSYGPAKGFGVYNCLTTQSIFIKWVGTYANERHPSPWCDSKLVAKHPQFEDYNERTLNRCGFSSLSQLRAWFYDSDILAQLGAAGIVLTVYKVKTIFRGSTQAFIRPEEHANGLSYDLADVIENRFNLKKCVAKNLEICEPNNE